MEVILKLNEEQRGAFILKQGDKQIGEMDIAVRGNEVIVYHTEISPEAEGKGLSMRLMEALNEYARENNFKVNPLCSFVHGQFKKHPDMYKDLWNSQGK